MYYNLQSFGYDLRQTRTNLGLTQKEVCKLSSIHVDTLRKIENGKVTPTQETLDLLSPVLKKDLNQLLLKYRLNNYSTFKKIRNILEAKIDRGEYETLSIELDDLEALLNTESNTYFINLINQLKLLTESIILNKKYNKLNESLDKLIEAIKITTPVFSFDNYKTFVYNSIELRILMNIAILINKIECTEESLEIMEFCIKSVEPNDCIYPKICYNLAYTYHRLDIHEKALKYSNLGINYCNEHRNHNGLNHLYFRKGIAEYHLEYNNYKDSLKKAIVFSEMLGQYNLKNIIIINCRKLYNINIQL